MADKKQGTFSRISDIVSQLQPGGREGLQKRLKEREARAKAIEKRTGVKVRRIKGIPLLNLVDSPDVAHLDSLETANPPKKQKKKKGVRFTGLRGPQPD